MGYYLQKLLDPRWQKKKSIIMLRDDFMCARCGDKNTTLHVHHKRYYGEPWDVLDSDLETLCKNCHHKEHFSNLPEPETTRLNDDLESVPKKDPEVVFEIWLIDNNFRLKSLKHHYLSIIHWIVADGDENTTIQAKNDLSEWCYKSKIIFVASNGDVYGEKENVVRHG